MAALARRFLPVGLFAALALTIVGPWLRPGYIFALDMVFTPRLRMPENLTSSYLFHAFLHLLNYILPSQIIEKIILFSIFFLSGYGMYRLVRYMGAGRAGAYIGGVMYAINPFVYDRLMVGQYSVLLGYALLPFFVRHALVFLQQPTLRSGIWLAVWASAISVMSIHTLGLLAVVAIIGGGAWLYKNRHEPAWRKRFCRWSLATIAIFTILSCYWLVPLAIGKGSTAAQVADFTSGDFAAFATLGGSFAGKLFHVLSLRGFWAENHGLYLQPDQTASTWYLLMVLWWAIIVVGIVGMWRQKQRALAALFSGVLAAGAILATGLGIETVARHVALLGGFREPQKFAGLVALSFAVFGGFGSAYTMRYVATQFENRRAAIVPFAFILLVPVLTTSTLLWGARGQLQPHQYPDSWTKLNEKLNTDHDTFSTLFLPWHLYMRFEFAGRVITNPAPQFFDKHMVTSDQAEIGDAAAVHASTATQALDKLLSRPSQTDFAQKLAQLHIKYIVLDKEEDYQTYDYLNQLPAVQPTGQYGHLMLYKNNTYGENHAR